MHSHFVERTNERTARKFTSYLSLPPSLPPALPACLPACSSLCISLSSSLRTLLCFSREILRVCNKPALTNPSLHTRSLSLARFLVPSFPRSLVPSLSARRSLFLAVFPSIPVCHHRNSGWKSLNCTHSHARAFCSRCDDLVFLPSSGTRPISLHDARPAIRTSDTLNFATRGRANT